MKKIPFKLRDLTGFVVLRAMLGDHLGEKESALHFLIAFNETQLINVNQ